jgi:hypothetical protein
MIASWIQKWRSIVIFSIRSLTTFLAAPPPNTQRIYVGGVDAQWASSSNDEA